MSQERSRAARTAPRAGLVRSAATLALALAGSLPAPAFAQFPPPARPPKMATEAAKPAAVAATLPSARSILDRHVAAIGGRKAVLGHKSTHARGTVAMPSAGVTGVVEIYGAHPNRTLLKISLSGVGDVVEGFDGKHAWSMSPITGPMLLEGKQYEERKFDADFHGELRPDDRYSAMTTVERTDFEGRPCYKLRLVRKSGGEDIEFYDVDTGLKAGSITSRETHMGTVTGTTIEGDYRKFGDVLLATTVRSKIGGLEQVVTITSVEYDTVKPSVFELPTEIKALLK